MEALTVKTPGLVYLSAGNIYTGCHGGMWYRLWMDKEAVHACVWPVPWCYDKTDDADKTCADFSPDAAGIDAAARWAEAQYAENLSRWHAASDLPPVAGK